MSLFRRKPRVVRRGSEDGSVEERTTRRVGREEVTVRRVRQAPEPQSKADRKPRRQRGERSPAQSKGGKKRPRHLEVVAPADTARRQMLVRRLPHQIQIVVLEGPVLVEHYVAKSDKSSLVGNVYLGKVRNVLPGMEAAFVDFGEGKNGVLYAGDIQGRKGRRSRIEDQLKNGDDVLVQVSKDAMGHKGARLTNEVSLAGRYLVLAPGAEIKGISRRLAGEERERLRRIIDKVRPKDFGVIVRTAAESASEDDLRADVRRLEQSWKDINQAASRGGGPKLLHEEPPLEIRVIREHFTRDFRQLLVDDGPTKDRIAAYLAETEPDLASKVKLYQEKEPLFERYHVDDQLRKALDRKVWLPSGGHVVIERTEALTVIDVNTGRFVGHSNLEETVLQNNLEAAEEVARQLRLRDIGGIIVIDFIDMEIVRNRDAVILRLQEHLAKDRTRTQVFEVSNLGLVEMTRKNVSEGLLESFSEVCDKCSGRGVLLHEEAATSGQPMPNRTSEAARN